MEMTAVGLGSKWVEKVVEWYSRKKDKRIEDLNEVNAVLTQDPRELARLYIEPDLQLINPANSERDEVDEEDAEFRIPAYRWLDSFLVRPKRRDGRHVAFILSDAGMGKSSLLAMLKVSATQGSWPGVNFRLFRIEPGIANKLDLCRDPANTVLLLDSLDEDPSAFGQIEHRIIELLTITKNFRQVLVTCRTQFFPPGNRFEKDGARITIGGHTCKVVYLSPFDERQVDEYLRKAFPGDPRSIKEAREVVYGMKSLRMRPMLLAHIEDLLEADVTNWTPYRVHRALVDVWLNREEAKLGSQVTAQKLRHACQTIAVALQIQGRRLIEDNELGQLLGAGEVNYVRKINIGGRSLLNRTSDGAYRFSHYSIQEFMVADRLIADDGAALASKVRFSEELVSFLVSYYLETHARVRLPEAKLGAANLRGGYFKGAVLRGAYLRSADLRGADLRDADLTNCDLEEADLANADLEGAKLDGATLRFAEVSGARLCRVSAKKANLKNANLGKTDLRGTSLLHCVGLGAKQLAEAIGDRWTLIPEGEEDLKTKLRKVLRPTAWPDQASVSEREDWLASGGEFESKASP
jgi:uncharacterized protein YjbI with pentapeptide repeats